MHARVGASAPIDSPAVVLVHGLGVSSRYMAPTAELVADDLPAYAVDLPGFGLSSKPDRALDIQQLAAALAAWLTEAGLEPPVLVANSFGCQVAAELAVAHPELVDSLVLLAPTVDPGARSTGRQLRRWLLTVPWEKPSLQRVIALDYRDAGLSRVSETARIALRDRIETKLPRIGARVLVVRGSRDRVVPQRWAEQAAALAPRGRLTVIPRAPHCLNFSAPDESAALVGAFARGGASSAEATRR